MVFPFFFPFHLRYDMVVNDISEFLKCLWLLCFIWHCGISIQLWFLWKFRCLHALASCKPFKLIIYCCRGGGDLLRQLHRLAEAESNLVIHQKRLSEIEAKVAVSSFYQIKGRRIMHLVLVKINYFWIEIVCSYYVSVYSFLVNWKYLYESFNLLLAWNDKEI